MLTHSMTSAALAATLVSPLSAAPAPAPAETSISDIEMVELVREEVGIWFTVKVNQACTKTHPYVHADGWVGTLPEHVYFTYQYDGVAGGPATAIRGAMTNWNFETRSVPLDLKCTSDLGQAMRIPSR